MKEKKVKFLADENVSPKVVAFLRSVGVNVLDVKEKKWFGRRDIDLIRRATKEKRFVLTHDLDFGEFVFFRRIDCYGIVILKLKNLKSSKVIQTLGYLLKERKLLQSGCIVVVQEGLVRQRTLPRVKRENK